jgi:voltage-gated potassium channel
MPEQSLDPGVAGRPGRELKSIGYEIFVAAVSVLSIINLGLIVLTQGQSLEYVLFAMNALFSLILFGDFCYRMVTSSHRMAYFVRGFGWADLLASLPLPQVKVLRVFRLVRVFRLLSDYGPAMVMRSLTRDRAGSALFLLLLMALLVLEFGSLAMLRLEQDAPGSTITSASDALWYNIVTMATVGYGDTYPVTNAGRLLGSVVIVIGVGIFGTLTGFLANAFLGSHQQPAQDADGAGSGDSSTQASSREQAEMLLAQVRETLAQQQGALAEIERLLRRP